MSKRAITLSVPLVGRWALALASIACSEALLAQSPVPVSGTKVQALRTLRATPTTAPGRLLEITAELEPGQDPVAQQPAAPQTPEEAAKMQAQTQRLQQFQQLVFDRRPSSILAAWAGPELKPYDPAEEEKEKKDGEPSGAAQPGAAVGAVPAVDVSQLDGMSAEEIAKALEQSFVAPEGAPPTAAGNPEAAAAAAAAAAEAKAKAEEQALAQKKQKRELEMLQRDVTLGRWQAFPAFLETLAEKDRKPAYEHFLKVLPRHPQQQNSRVPPNLQEKNRFSFEDALVLAGMAPGGFDKAQAKLLAPIVRRAIDDGAVVEELLRLLSAEVNKAADAVGDPAAQRLDRREVALLLIELGQDAEIGVFLPTATAAEADNDREALNLLARHALAMYAKERRNVWLETAWQVTQAALAKGEVSKEQKEEALRRAVELAPKVQKELGPAWLAESFSSRPERGMEIIATIGQQVARGFEERAQDAGYRSAGLELQKTAVESLLTNAPELADAWRETLGLLAAGWVVEATNTYQNSRTTSFGPVMERDDFGNIFWTNRRMGGGGAVSPIEPVDLLKSQPGAQWAALLGEALRPHFLTVSAQLWLKVNEHDKAFPFIEQLAAVNPRKAKELAEEFLRVWMRNNNPNTNTPTNSYMFIYGFDQRANGIPLTRSKQERNLEELGSYVERLRQLPIDGVNESLLGEAFVAAHSVAEVYRLETIERVFGDIHELDPVLLGELLGKMRTNLATIWRRPDVQDAAKTKRSQKQMLDQVARGYDTALQIAEGALGARGKHWALLDVVAAIRHDRNNFNKEQARDSHFSDERIRSFELFREATDHYASIVDDLRLDQETVQPYALWFYAALGASDLGAIDEDTVLAESQLALIRGALDELSDGARERHQAMFANQLFTRMSAVKPQIKYRYLKAGFAVIGDHPQAAEAKKVWDYYQDLITELRLDAVVDGGTAVGTEPFGVRVDIVHSPEIARESGGFQKYATNQNSGSGYYYNYGRPLENYRDKFHDAVVASLQEHFEVLSITFNSEHMNAIPDRAPGWERTPYAFLLLQARGPQVDRIPEMKLDFDFLDTSGYVILPVTTATVSIDASAKAEVRPFAGLEVLQLLDERKIDEGKVTLEIKAKGQGLVPDLEQFMTLDTPGFVVDKRDDQGASVVRFAEDQEAVESERVWLLSLEPESAGATPGSFRFAKPRIEGVKATYQRYNDADLETVPAEVALNGLLRGPDPLWVWLLLGAATVAFVLWFVLYRPGGTAVERVDTGLRMPEQVTPFTVLGLLQRIAGRSSLDAAQQQRLQDDIRRIEEAHFGRADDRALDLGGIAAEWLRRAH
ncbi:MAG: hypothetical protein H6835_16150 [Planctomycetes bacterium]|nr:hypothetical protein [Planctomycetota bacterium]